MVVMVNGEQQDRIAIRVSDRGSKPDQLASIYENETNNEQYGCDLRETCLEIWIRAR